MDKDNLTAMRWIVHLSVFGASLWWFWDAHTYLVDYLGTILTSAIVSFVGGAVLRLPIEVAFNSDSEMTPAQKVMTFFVVLAIMLVILWGLTDNDNYSRDFL